MTHTHLMVNHHVSHSGKSKRQKSHEFPILVEDFSRNGSFRSHHFLWVFKCHIWWVTWAYQNHGKIIRKNHWNWGKFQDLPLCLHNFRHAHGPPRNFVTKTMMSCGPYNSTTCRWAASLGSCLGTKQNWIPHGLIWGQNWLGTWVQLDLLRKKMGCTKNSPA